MERHGNHIGGRSVEAATDAVLESRNPARLDEVLGVFPRSGAAEVDAAVAAARAALASWRATPWPARGEVLLRAPLLLEGPKAGVARRMTPAVGTALVEARAAVPAGVSLADPIPPGAARPLGPTAPPPLRAP